MSDTFDLHNREGSNTLQSLLTGLGFIRSEPDSGEFQVHTIRLDSDKKVVVKYDETAEA